MDAIESNRRILLKLAFVLAAVALAVPCSSQRPRSISGTVRDKAGNTLPKAVVELEDKVSLAIRSYIADPEGHYFFGEVNPDIEFTLKAHYRSQWSKTHTVSKFAEGRELHIDLVIPIE